MYALSWAVRRYRALPAIERRVFVQAALLVPAVHCVQQLLPFRRWRPLLTRVGVRRPGRSPVAPEQVAEAVVRAQRAVPGTYKCLPAAYATHLLLHWHGHPSVVQVGVARDAAGKVEAHAWVELEGRILIGALPDLARFVPLAPLPL